jgi:hypothetical protein
MVAAVAALKAVRVERLSPAMQKYLHQIEIFLREMDMPYSRSKKPLF